MAQLGGRDLRNLKKFRHALDFYFASGLGMDRTRDSP
jgi:hypothetical protein